MKSNMALLILSWQVACLYHKNEIETLLPGAVSATQKESDELDKIHDEFTPDVSWDDFNSVYASFKNAIERTEVCVSVLNLESKDYKRKVVDCMIRIAGASREENNTNNVSPDEKRYIDEVRAALGV